MAEKALQKVEDELTTCSICLDTYTNPKLLQCFHVYCQGCLTRLVFRDQQGQLVLTCPNCRQVTPVPAGGVAGLQSAFHINRLLGIMEEHKKGKDETAHAENSSPVRIPLHPPCSEHSHEEVKLYCETCGKLICLKCATKGGKHLNHSHELLDEAVRKYTEEIKSSLKPVERQMATVENALEELGGHCVEIAELQEAREIDIHATFWQLQETLEVRKTQLLDQLNQITQSKLKSLTAQKDQLKTTQAQLGSCLDFMKKSLQTDSLCDGLKAKAGVVKQIKELTAPLQPDLLKACTKADMVFSGSVSTLADCQNYGRLLKHSDLFPPWCHATGRGLEVASVEEKSTVTLRTVTYRNELYTEPVISIECDLISAITGTRVLGKVEKVEQYEYEISYQPTIKGTHFLHIKVEGQHITGSPFCVAVKNPIDTFDSPIQVISKIKGPDSMSLNHKHELVITDVRDHCIHVFSPNLKKLLSFGSRGSGHGQFHFPMGVAVDRDGNILVVDKGNHRIQKFSAGGRFLVSVGTRGRKQLQFDSPGGIAFSTSENKLYIADIWNHRVQVLNSDLTFFSTFGSGKGQFSQPRGIACDTTGNVYVADYDNHDIQVFTANGTFLKAFGVLGEAEGELNSPSGVAVDTNGMVYISEDGNHRISLFTSEGEFVYAFGRLGEDQGHFIHPRGLVVDGSGVVYVCDLDNNRIQIF